jgi:hypothetical protein
MTTQSANAARDTNTTAHSTAGADGNAETTASVAFMIPKRLKEQLRKRGFSDEAIRNMTPQAARDALRAATRTSELEAALGLAELRGDPLDNVTELPRQKTAHGTGAHAAPKGDTLTLLRSKGIPQTKKIKGLARGHHQQQRQQPSTRNKEDEK